MNNRITTKEIFLTAYIRNDFKCNRVIKNIILLTTFFLACIANNTNAKKQI